MTYKAKQRKQEKAIQSSKEGILLWDSKGHRRTEPRVVENELLVWDYIKGQPYYKGANQIKKANKGMRAKLMRLMEKMQ
jgi:hypothetical protein